MSHIFCHLPTSSSNVCAQHPRQHHRPNFSIFHSTSRRENAGSNKIASCPAVFLQWQRCTARWARTGAGTRRRGVCRGGERANPPDAAATGDAASIHYTLARASLRARLGWIRPGLGRCYFPRHPRTMITSESTTMNGFPGAFPNAIPS